MKKRERDWIRRKKIFISSRFYKLLFYYDVTRKMTPKQKRLLKKGLKK